MQAVEQELRLKGHVDGQGELLPFAIKGFQQVRADEVEEYMETVAMALDALTDGPELD